MLAWALGWIVLAAPAPTVAPAASASASAPAERFGLELRAGGQLPRSFPAAALYASVVVHGDWSVGVGYEMVRAYEVSLPKSCTTTVTPVVGAGLRAGVWRRVRLAHGFSLRGGLLLGGASPSLAVGAFPDGVSGGAFESGLDLEAMWHWRSLELAVYATPTLALGSFSTNVCPAMPASAGVTDVGLHFGLSLGVRL